MINEIIYSLLASFLIGAQFILVSYINHINKTIFNVSILIFLILLFLIISRILIYYANKKIEITIIHSILNTSILFTVLLSVIIYKTNVNVFIFLLGFLFLNLGIMLIRNSIMN